MNEASTLIELIAPCGMDCRLCRAYRRQKKPCPGCRIDSALKPKARTECRIRNCTHMKESNHRYCFPCGDFPCDTLRRLDKRYRTNYTMSMIDNLREIALSGDELFLLHQDERWTCRECGKLLSVHRPACPFCGRLWKDGLIGGRNNGSASSDPGSR
jgi:hypothetical protein